MYCSNCASAIKPELNYCNSCGQRISGKAENLYDPVSKNLSSSLGYIGVFAVIGFVFLIMSLLDYGIGDGRLIALAFVYLAAIFGIIYLILQKIGSRKSESDSPVVSHQAESPVLQPVNTNQLEPPQQAPASVVENTTRTLGKVPVERE